MFHAASPNAVVALALENAMNSLEGNPTAVDHAIMNRKTVKVLAAEDLPVRDVRDTLADLVQLAGMAPFHRACEEMHRAEGELAGIEPWRFYIVDAENCRRLKHQIPLENAGKIPAMLSAADALIIATWLPNSGPEGDGLFDPTLGNMEHIAAASAAVQNLLLAATARGIANYWSSGGVLRERAVFQKLNIPDREILLAAIFFFPQETGAAEVASSKLREHRSSANHWSRWITLGE